MHVRENFTKQWTGGVMARPIKQTVDYFPHDCDHKKTMFIIEQKYGNDGYAFWFKLLETLGTSAGHYIDLNEPGEWEFLTSKTRVTDVICEEILNLLAKLEAIDTDLWKERIVWSQNFIERIKDAYRNRTVGIPRKPDFLRKKQTCEGGSLRQSDDINQQSKVKENKVKEKTLCVYSNAFQSFWDEYPKHTSKKSALKEWKSIPNKPPIDAILEALRAQKRNKAELQAAGQFCPEWPDPERWIKKERWNDEIIKIKINTGGNGALPKPNQTYAEFIPCKQCREPTYKPDLVDGICYSCHNKQHPREVKYDKPDTTT